MTNETAPCTPGQIAYMLGVSAISLFLCAYLTEIVHFVGGFVVGIYVAVFLLLLHMRLTWSAQ